jgi:hypothetical protein
VARWLKDANFMLTPNKAPRRSFRNRAGKAGLKVGFAGKTPGFFFNR